MRRNKSSPPRHHARGRDRTPLPPRLASAIRSRTNSPLRFRRSRSPVARRISPGRRRSPARNFSPSGSRSSRRISPPVKKNREGLCDTPRPGTSRGLNNRSPSRHEHSRGLPDLLKKEPRNDTDRREDAQQINFDDLKGLKIEIKRPDLATGSLVGTVTIRRRSGEGSRPIFDREEIKNHAMQYDEDLTSSFKLGRLIDERSRGSPHSRDSKSRETDRSRNSDRSRERDRRHRSEGTSSPRRVRSLDRSRENRESRLRSPDGRIRRTRTPDRRSPRRDDNNRNAEEFNNGEHFYEDGHAPIMPHLGRRGGIVMRGRGIVGPHFMYPIPVPMMRPGPPRPIPRFFPRPMPTRLRPPVFGPPGPGYFP